MQTTNARRIYTRALAAREREAALAPQPPGAREHHKKQAKWCPILFANRPNEGRGGPAAPPKPNPLHQDSGVARRSAPTPVPQKVACAPASGSSNLSHAPPAVQGRLGHLPLVRRELIEPPEPVEVPLATVLPHRVGRSIELAAARIPTLESAASWGRRSILSVSCSRRSGVRGRGRIPAGDQSRDRGGQRRRLTVLLSGRRG